MLRDSPLRLGAIALAMGVLLIPRGEAAPRRNARPRLPPDCLVAVPPGAPVAAPPSQPPDPLAGLPYRLTRRDDVQGLLDLAVDARGRAWGLRTMSIVRLDETGSVAQEIPLRVGGTSGARLHVLANGTFTAHGFHVAADGRPLHDSPLPKWVSVQEALGDGLLVLTQDGLRVLGIDGADQGQVGAYGWKGATAGLPSALAVGGGRIAVLVDGRVDVYDAGPERKPLGSVGEGTPRPFPLGRGDIALDSRGWLYVHPGGLCQGGGPVRGIQVFHANLDSVVAIPIETDGFVVDGGDRILATCQGRLAVLEPVGEGVHALTPQPLAPPPNGRAVSVSAVEATWQPTARLSHRLHVDGPRVNALAWDPADPQVLWIGAHGGLWRWNRSTRQWRRWTREDGLPASHVSDIAFDTTGRTLWIASSQPCRLDVASGRLEVLARPASSAQGVACLRVLPPRRSGDPLAFQLQQQLLALSADGRWTALDDASTQLVPIAGTADHLALQRQEIVRIEPGSGRVRVLATARALADEVAGPRHPVSARMLASVTLDRWGGRAWIAANGIGLIPVLLATGAPGRAIGPPPARDFLEGADPIVQSAGPTFVIGRHDIGRLEGDSIRWLWDLLAVDAQRAWSPVARAVADPLDPEVLWLALTTGVARFDTRSGALELHAPPDGDIVSGDWWGFGESAGRLWGWREPVPGAELGGVLAREPGTRTWRRVASLPKHARLVGTDRNGWPVVTEAVGSEEASWRIDPVRLVATAHRLDEPRPAQGTWAVAHDGTTMLSLAALGLGSPQALCESSGGAPQCTPLQQLGETATHATGLVLDPRNPRVAWLASWRGLTRVDRDAARADLVADGGFTRLHVVAGRYLWADGFSRSSDGGRTLRWDLVEGKGLPVRARGPSWPDPGDPESAWVALPGQLQLVALATSEVLVSRDVVGLAPARRLIVTRDDATGRRIAWVETADGLAEVPLEAEPPLDSVPSGAVPARY